MNDRLWEAHRETPFASLMMQRKLDLRPQEHTATLKVLSDMASSGETQNGYRIKRVASHVQTHSTGTGRWRFPEGFTLDQ